MQKERPEAEHASMGSRQRDRARSEKRRLAKRVVPVAVALAAGFAIAAVAIRRPPAPPGSAPPPMPAWGSIEPVVEDFASAWNGNRLKEMEALLPPATRDRQARILERVLKRRG